MSDVVQYIKEKFIPPPTDKQLREKWLTKTLGLKKDGRIPNLYWIDDQTRITVLTGDEESFSNAVIALREYFRAPKIEKVSPDTSAHSPFQSGDKSSSGKGGIIGSLSDAWREIEPIAKNASITSEKSLTAEGLGFDPAKAESELLSMKDAPRYTQIGYDDFMGKDPSPKPKDKSKKKKQNRGDAIDDFM